MTSKSPLHHCRLLPNRLSISAHNFVMASICAETNLVASQVSEGLSVNPNIQALHKVKTPFSQTDFLKLININMYFK